MLALLIAQAADTSSDYYRSGYAVGRLIAYIFIAAVAFILIRRFLERRRASKEEPSPEPSNGQPTGGNGAKADALTPGKMFDTGPMETELEGIYRKLGAPDGIDEAKGKVRQLARELSSEKGVNPDEALYRAYKVSLDQHREYASSRS